MIRTILLLFALAASAYGQLWSGVLDTTRAIDWTNAGVIGGIPSGAWTQCGSTIAAGASAATVQTAINGCAANHFVKLGVGSFSFATSLNMKSGVVLRGSGANQTILAFSNEAACGWGGGGNICFSGNTQNFNNAGEGLTKTWTAGFSKGTTVITLNNTTGISTTANGGLGTYLLLDQLNDPNTDNGAVWICETAGVCAPTGEGPSGGQRSGRAQGQYVRVTGISGNNVTISPGLYMPNWRIGQTPGVWFATADDLNYAGIEDMSIQVNSAPYASFVFFHASNCWIKGVRSIINSTNTSYRNHVNIIFSNHNTIKDNYFYDASSWQSTSYTIENYLGSDNLVENNIFHRMAAPIVLNGIASGMVIAYNFNINNQWCPNENPDACDNTSLRGMVWNHAAGGDYILLEGNIGPAYFADQYHGTHYFNTIFRNQFQGWQTSKTTDLTPVIYEVFSRYFNDIGNVHGHSGTQTTYSQIFDLGSSVDGGIPSDPKVALTLMRWGNYDVATANTRWCGNSSSTRWSTTCASTSEVPTGLALYSNAVPATETLPSSFYLSAKPAWFGSITWPPIGPEVTGGNLANLGGHAFKNPAQVCYESMSGPATGTGSVLSFNADTCYAASGPVDNPLAPSALSVIQISTLMQRAGHTKFSYHGIR